MSLAPSGRIKFLVTGARGATFADVARGSGAFGAQPSDSDAQVSQKFADYAIQQNPDFKGEKGDQGPPGTDLVISNEGLSVKVNSFSMADDYGNNIDFSAKDIVIPPNGKFHLGYDLFDGIVRPLRYRLHSGCMWLGTVTTNANSVVGIVQEPKIMLPHTRLPQYRAKEQTPFSPLRIVQVGTSLIDGAGTGTLWWKLLSDTANASTGLNLSAIDRITYTNAALGGSTAHHSLMQLGESTYSNGGGFGNTEITMGKYYQSLNKVRKAVTRKSPWLAYDVLLIGSQANGGTYNLSFIENCIRRARKAGMEVVIVTENNRTDNRDNFIADSFPMLRKLADAYGCAIADTWSYMRYVEDMGTNCHADVIHQNADGHIAYGRAVRSVFNQRSLPPYRQGLPDRRIMLPNDGSAVRKFPSVAQVQFEPYFTDGTLDSINPAFYSPQYAPGMAFGGRNVNGADYLYKLTTNQRAHYGHSCAQSMDIILAQTDNCTIEVRTQDRNTLLQTINVPGNGTANNIVVEGPQLGAFSDVSAGQSSVANRGIQIVCTAGTARIVGVVFHTPEISEVPFHDMQFLGTWATEEWIYGVTYSRYSDTVGDSVIIPFTGTALALQLGKRAAGGKVDIYIDNERIYTDLDLSGNAFVSGTVIQARTLDTNEFSTGYGEHVVAVVLKTLNATASTPSSRNLSVVAAYALDMR